MNYKNNKNSIGGGLLSLPFAISKSGVILGVMMVMFCSLCAGYAAQLLINCGLPPISSGRSYPELSSHLFGKKLGPIILNVVLVKKKNKKKKKKKQKKKKKKTKKKFFF